MASSCRIEKKLPTIISAESIGISDSIYDGSCVIDEKGGWSEDLSAAAIAFLKFSYHNGTTSRSIIDSYNYFVSDVIPKICEDLPVISRSKSKSGNEKVYRTYFSNITVTKPSYESTKIVNGKVVKKIRPLYPANAYHRHTHYMGKVYGQPVRYHIGKDGNRKYETYEKTKEAEETVFIGNLMVMVGSSVCNLSGITNKEKLMKLGMDPHDPMGYFIVNGMAKVVVNIEKLRLHKYLVFPGMPKKAELRNPSCRIIVKIPTGTRQIMVTFNSTNTVVLNMSIFLKNRDGKTPYTVNVLHMADIIDTYFMKNKLLKESQEYNDKNGLVDEYRPVGIISQFKQIMKTFCPVEEWSEVSAAFSFTEGEYSVTVEDSFKTKGLTEEKIKQAYIKRVKAVTGSLLANMGVKAQSEMKDKLADVVSNHLFPNVQGLSTDRLMIKIEMMAIMTIHLLRYKLGFRKADDKDSWANKMISPPGDTMAQIFRNALKKSIFTIQKNIDAQPDMRTFDRKAFVQSYNHEKFMDKDMEQAFVNSTFGSTNSYSRESITDMADTNNALSMMSHLSKIDAKMIRGSTVSTARAVQETAECFIAPEDTPDDKHCGIVKRFACGCLITVHISDVPVKRYIKRMKILSPVRDNDHPDYILLNSIMIGWANGKVLYDLCVKARRMNIIPRMTEVVVTQRGYVEIFTDSGRMVRPVFVVDPDTGLPLISEKEIREISFAEMLKRGYIDYIGSAENEFVNIAYQMGDLTDTLEIRELISRDIRKTQEEIAKIEDYLEDDPIEKESRYDLMSLRESLQILESRKKIEDVKWNFLELHPVVMMGISASTIPYLNHVNGCRISFQAKMNRQAMSISSFNRELHNGTTKNLMYPTMPVVQTSTLMAYGLDTRPTGRNMEVAILTYSGNNQEDAIVANKTSLSDVGILRYRKTIQYNTYVSSDRNVQTLKRPELKRSEKSSRYRYINENGLPSIGAVLMEKDCIIGRTKYSKSDPQKRESNDSVFVSTGDYGVVKDVKVFDHQSKGKFVSVLLEVILNPMVGNKQTPRCSQKGVIGALYNREDMPFDQYGNVPDLIISAFAIPSRMTQNLMIEMGIASAAAYEGKRIDAIGFQSVDFNSFRRTLLKYSTYDRSRDYIDNRVKKSDVEPPSVVELPVSSKKKSKKSKRLGKIDVPPPIPFTQEDLDSYKNISTRKFQRRRDINRIVEEMSKLSTMRTKPKNYEDLIKTLRTQKSKMEADDMSDSRRISELENKFWDNKEAGLLSPEMDKLKMPKPRNRTAKQMTTDEALREFRETKEFDVFTRDPKDIGIENEKIEIKIEELSRANEREELMGKIRELRAKGAMDDKNKKMKAEMMGYIKKVSEIDKLNKNPEVKKVLKTLRAKLMSNMREITKPLGLGKRRLYNPITGEMIKVPVMMGTVYYQSLIHIAEDKFQSCARGTLSETTRQNIRGKQKGGAVRFGEMEFRVAMSNKVPRFIHGRMCRHSDSFEVVVCINCGYFANINLEESEYVCDTCDQKNFGKITIPYVFKYLMQILSSVGIRIRIITKTSEQMIKIISHKIQQNGYEIDTVDTGIEEEEEVMDDEDDVDDEDEGGVEEENEKEDGENDDVGEDDDNVFGSDDEQSEMDDVMGSDEEEDRIGDDEDFD